MLLKHPEYATLMLASSNKPAIPFAIKTTCHTYGEVCSAEFPVAVSLLYDDRPQVALGLSLCLPGV